MQKPVRYYISQSGEEPTVRSVHVALGPRPADAPIEPAPASAELVPTVATVTTPASAVTRRVKDAIRGRKTVR